MNVPANKEMARLLRFIAKGAAATVETQSSDKLVLESGAYGMISATRNVVKFTLSQGLVALSKGKISISDAGRACYAVSNAQTRLTPGNIAAKQRS